MDYKALLQRYCVCVSITMGQACSGIPRVACGFCFSAELILIFRWSAFSGIPS